MAEEREDPLPELYHACMANDLARVRQLLAAGADPNDGESVYHSAQENRRECLELLLAHGADLSGRNATYHNTPLYFLAGHRPADAQAKTALEGMAWLLAHGADPNVTSYESAETPLHAAARTGWTEAAALFLAHGADVNARRADRRTPYVIAVRNGHDELATLLREHEADATGIRTEDEFLGYCLKGDEARASALLAANPGLIAALTVEDKGSVVQAVYDRGESAIRLMVRLGFDLGWESSWGGTPLHHAAWRGDAGLVRALLELGAPVDARDRQYGSSALGWVAHGSSNFHGDGADHPEVARLLLDAGAGRAPSINRWGEPPEGMASPAVESLLRARGFAP